MSDNKISFEQFYIENKDKTLKEILDFLCIYPSWSPCISDKSKNQLIQYLNIEKYLEKKISFYDVVYKNVYIGYYKDFSYLMYYRVYKNIKHFIIEINLKLPLRGSIEISNRINNYNYSHKLTFFLVLKLSFLSIVFISLISGLIQDIGVALVLLYFSGYLIPYIFDDVSHILKANPFMLSKNDSFKTKHSVTVKASDEIESKRIVSASLMKNFHNMNRVFNSDIMNFYFTDNKFFGVFDFDKHPFKDIKINDIICSEQILKDIYEKITSVFKLIDYLEQNINSRKN